MRWILHDYIEAGSRLKYQACTSSGTNEYHYWYSVVPLVGQRLTYGRALRYAQTRTTQQPHPASVSLKQKRTDNRQRRADKKQRRAYYKQRQAKIGDLFCMKALK